MKTGTRLHTAPSESGTDKKLQANWNNNKIKQVFRRFREVFRRFRTCSDLFVRIRMHSDTFGCFRQKKIEKKIEKKIKKLSKILGSFSMFSGGFGGAGGKRTSKSARASNFAPDTPILRSVQPKIAKKWLVPGLRERHKQVPYCYRLWLNKRTFEIIWLEEI